MARLLKANGGVEVLTVPPSGIALDELQRLVGGYVEVVSLERPSARYAVLVINENGLNEGLPVNVAATMLYRSSRVNAGDSVIVGDVVLAEMCYPGGDNERLI